MSGEKLMVESILSGKQELFAKIITAHNELLYRVGRSYINNHEEVEDLMQTTYLKAYERLSQFNFQSSITTWITRIMINECLMYLRKEKRNTAPIPVDVDESISLDFMDSQTFESQINYEELKAICEKMVLQLPDEYRLVFLLREVQKLPSKDVAEIAEISEENVRIRLYRAKRMLQKLILDHLGESDIYGYHKKYCNKLTAEVMNKILNQSK